MGWDCDICGGGRGDDHSACSAAYHIGERLDRIIELLEELANPVFVVTVAEPPKGE